MKLQALLVILTFISTIAIADIAPDIEPTPLPCDALKEGDSCSGWFSAERHCYPVETLRIDAVQGFSRRCTERKENDVEISRCLECLTEKPVPHVVDTTPKVYSNEEFQFSVQYPVNWRVVEGIGNAMSKDRHPSLVAFAGFSPADLRGGYHHSISLFEDSVTSVLAHFLAELKRDYCSLDGEDDIEVLGKKFHRIHYMYNGGNRFTLLVGEIIPSYTMVMRFHASEKDPQNYLRPAMDLMLRTLSRTVK